MTQATTLKPCRDPGHWLAGLPLALVRYLRAQRDYRHLGEMPDERLQDVGISRQSLSAAQDRSVLWYLRCGWR